MTKSWNSPARWAVGTGRRVLAGTTILGLVLTHSLTAWHLSDAGSRTLPLEARLALVSLAAVIAALAWATFRPAAHLSATGMLHVRNLGPARVIDPATVVRARRTWRGLHLTLRDGTTVTATALHHPRAVAQLADREPALARALGAPTPVTGSTGADTDHPRALSA